MSGGNLYRVCDLVVESSLALPELPAAEGGTPECRFEVARGEAMPEGEIRWYHEWRSSGEGGEAWLSLGRRRADYVLRFPAGADFVVAEDCREVKCYPLAGTPESTLRHLLLDQVLPLVLSRRERMVLHASAVLADGGAIGFAGRSGRGKSTLAASLAREGWPLLSDDCLVLRRAEGSWRAIPSYPGVRLWPDAAEGVFQGQTGWAEVAHYTVKRRVGDHVLAPFSGEPAPLGRLYFLEEAGKAEVSISRMTPQEAFMQLVGFAYNLDITDKAFLERQFETIGGLVAEVGCYRLDYPREIGALPRVREGILSHSRGEGSNGNRAE
jgi:hypothetical protein